VNRRINAFAIATVFLFVACTDSDPAGVDDDPEGLVGSWVGTSLLWGGDDLFLGGTTLTLTFTAAGTFSGASTNSPIGLYCDNGPDCTINGVYTSTATGVVFDSNDPPEDQTPMSYTANATTLVLSGPVDGLESSWTFTRTP